MVDFNLSDEQLVVIVREQNPELYGEIIKRYQTKLSHYLRKFIKDADEIEDILQDVFIKAYKNLYGFDAKKKFSSWIYRITHNEAINYIKKNFRMGISLDDVEHKLFDEKIDLELSVDSGLDKRKIEQALLKIKNKYREPIILFFSEEKTYEEISDILRIPINTVGTFISRGKKELKELLKK